MAKREKDWSGSFAEIVFLIVSLNAGKFSEPAVQSYRVKRWILLSKGSKIILEYSSRNTFRSKNKRIDKLQIGQRTTTKMNKTLWREVAVSTASELYKTDEKLITCHRKEADNDFLTAFIGELKDKVQVRLMSESIITFFRLKIE